MDDDYQFEDAETTVNNDSSVEKEGEDASTSAFSEGGAYSPGRNNGGQYADELFSKKINAKFRTFYVDLKQSSNGKFVKISEKSHGRKSTIMMDAEDISEMINALQEVQGKL
ncbi:hypothetical protein COY07_05745 [Candidatus Peregrinibacteria bacterium CG_4_10_14_0_2_um_filter_43_11]|nr:MAG: hypothetical protein COY07_05745 [Candidatus Peregrinibacteria bacterium CG_4_10_14_0_2_um_filter_43_11]